MASLYWRLYITATNGSGNTNCAEIEMRATVGGADQCTGGTVTESSFFAAPYVGASAFDNNNGTMWVATSVPAWVRYQFASAVNVVEYTIRVRSDGFTNEAPQDWELQASVDGSGWIPYDTRTAQTGWSAGEQRTFLTTPPVTGTSRVTQVVAEVLRVRGAETPLPPSMSQQPIICIVS